MIRPPDELWRGQTRKVVFLSHTHVGGPFSVGSHHLARSFARQGISCLHVSTAADFRHFLGLSPVARSKRAAALHSLLQGARFPEERICAIVPSTLVPYGMIPPMRQRTRLLDLTSLRLPGRAIRETFSDADLVLIDEPLLAGAEQWFPNATALYRATDVNPLLTGRPGRSAFDSRLLERCAGFVGTSQAVVDHLSALAPDLPHQLLPNAAWPISMPPVQSERPTDLPSGHVLVYVGALDERFGWDALASVLERMPFDHQVALIGPEPRHPPVSDSRIHYLGTKAHEDLLPYLLHAVAGLFLTSDHPANDGRSPLKVFEYLAAGLRVLATPTQELLRLDLRGLHFLLPSPAWPLQESWTDQSTQDLRRWANEHHSWMTRSRELLAFAESLR